VLVVKTLFVSIKFTFKSSNSNMNEFIVHYNSSRFLISLCLGVEKAFFFKKVGNDVVETKRKNHKISYLKKIIIIKSTFIIKLRKKTVMNYINRLSNGAALWHD
jgi:hypothetical protein